jgi:hypothetical protein
MLTTLTIAVALSAPPSPADAVARARAEVAVKNALATQKAFRIQKDVAYSLAAQPLLSAPKAEPEAVVAAPKKAAAPKACPCDKCHCADKADCPAGCPAVIVKAPAEQPKTNGGGEGWSCGPTGCVFTPKPEGEGWQWHTEGKYWWRFTPAAPSFTSVPTPVYGCPNGQCGQAFAPAPSFPVHGGCANGQCGVGYAPAPVYSFPAGGCANGQCGSFAPRSFRTFGGGGCSTCR